MYIENYRATTKKMQKKKPCNSYAKTIKKMKSYKMLSLKPEKSERVVNPQKSKETKSKGNKQKTVINMFDINPTISIITFNINGLNTPIKTQ